MSVSVVKRIRQKTIKVERQLVKHLQYVLYADKVTAHSATIYMKTEVVNGVEKKNSFLKEMETPFYLVHIHKVK